MVHIISKLIQSSIDSLLMKNAFSYDYLYNSDMLPSLLITHMMVSQMGILISFACTHTRAPSLVCVCAAIFMSSESKDNLVV